MAVSVVCGLFSTFTIAQPVMDVASDQRLHCLPLTQQLYTYSQVVKWDFLTKSIRKRVPNFIQNFPMRMKVWVKKSLTRSCLILHLVANKQMGRWYCYPFWCSSSLLLRRWFHMWRLFCHCVVLIYPSCGTSGNFVVPLWHFLNTFTYN